MKVSVIAVGRMRSSAFQAACDDYLGRLRRHFPTRVVEVKEPSRRKGGSADLWRAQEADALLNAVPPNARIIALDERGETWSSTEFADRLQRLRDTAVPEVCCLIGGPDGLDHKVRSAAWKVWAMGRLTLPHELARLVLIEQIYRAGTLMSGQPYHR